jgi:hypothetical protein
LASRCRWADVAAITLDLFGSWWRRTAFLRGALRALRSFGL